MCPTNPSVTVSFGRSDGLRCDFSTNKLTISMSNICQSFQTLYEASPIINVTHRSFAVFHPIMCVTHRSFAAPAPVIRDFFWLYHTYSLLRGGFYNASSGFGPEAKTLLGQLMIFTQELKLHSPESGFQGGPTVRLRSTETQSTYNICSRGGRRD